MASTYLELTNRVLRRLNEVELTSSDFASPRGVHATVKDAVLDTVRKINNSKYKWPFNAQSGTQVLTIGQELYSLPSGIIAADWESFQIEKDDTLSVNHKHLKPINREEWYRTYRDLDQDAESDGKTVPEFVFDGPNSTWGLTPSPDKAYTVTFKYWTSPTAISAHGDTVTIPDDFDYVITAGALYHLYLFLDNSERTQLAKQAYDEGIKEMVNRYFKENRHHFTSKMVNL